MYNYQSSFVISIMNNHLSIIIHHQYTINIVNYRQS